MTSVLKELLVRPETDPAFKIALREASDAELKEAIGALDGDEKSIRKLGRLRAALRRLSFRMR